MLNHRVSRGATGASSRSSSKTPSSVFKPLYLSALIAAFFAVPLYAANDITVTTNELPGVAHGNSSDPNDSILDNDADPNGNKLTIDSGGVVNNAYGALIDNTSPTAMQDDDVTHNEVIIQGTGRVEGTGAPGYGVAAGGRSNSAGGSGGGGEVSFNKATITGGETVNIVGGWSDKGASLENTVSVEGGTVSDEAYGGAAQEGDASHNHAFVKGGSIANGVFGGSVRAATATGAADSNDVTITGGDIVGGIIYGGRNAGTGNANSNTVIINANNGP
ncbi:MAG: hypothetical protein LBG61_07570, partial [Burkholderiales bacterium]|nr:hypothetical protein [Burkholderiales bacterium]